MFNATGLTKGLSFPKIIGGISKTLQIANQVIPLYQKAKPIISNARSIMGVLKGMTKENPKILEATNAVVKSASKTKTTDNLNNSTKKIESTSPTFFL